MLGLDRAPEVKTIRRNITGLSGTGRAEELLAAMAAAHVTRLDRTSPDLLAVFYVDGHIRACQGGRKVAKTHLPRLKFPAPVTVETWVSDATQPCWTRRPHRQVRRYLEVLAGAGDPAGTSMVLETDQTGRVTAIRWGTGSQPSTSRVASDREMWRQPRRVRPPYLS